MDSAHRSESFRGSPLIELESLLNRLDAKKIFGRRAALHVDLDCADGAFLCALDQRVPGRLRSAAVKAAKIRNVHVLRMESSYVVRYLLPPRSVETFYLLFPDPWPKRRHWRRRIVTPDLLKAVSQALVHGGNLLIATDHLSYFEKIKEIAQANLDLAIVDPANVDLPQSRFARVFQQQGAAIHWLELRKVSPVR